MAQHDSSVKTALVTGAAGGMAQGINHRLHLAGWSLVCADLHEADAQGAAQAVREAGGQAIGISLDVSSDRSVAEAAARLTEQGITIDAVVNAAGVMDRRGLSELAPADFERVLAVNLTGPYRVIREFAPAMLRQKWGRIVNISSFASRNGYPFPGYTVSKAGLSHLTRSLINDFWGTGVTVNNVCPGPVDTPMLSDAVRSEIGRHLPTAEVITPEEIGASVAFLLSDDARSIMGADLVVDGGASAYFQVSNRE